jgi:ankyrin repeat protein
MSATLNNQNPVVRYLLEDGTINVDAKNDFGVSALMCAVYQRNFSTTMMLLNAGAHVAYDVSNSFQKPLLSPLMLAATRGDAAILNALLQYGAESNVQSKLNGWTSLMHAARCPHATKEMIQLLFDYGADGEVKNWCGQTALDIAKETGNSEVIEVLEAHHSSNMGDEHQNEGIFMRGCKQCVCGIYITLISSRRTLYLRLHQGQQYGIIVRSIGTQPETCQCVRRVKWRQSSHTLRKDRKSSHL